MPRVALNHGHRLCAVSKSNWLQTHSAQNPPTALKQQAKLGDSSSSWFLHRARLTRQLPGRRRYHWRQLLPAWNHISVETNYGVCNLRSRRLIEVTVLAADYLLIDLAHRSGRDFIYHLELFRQLPFGKTLQQVLVDFFGGNLFAV